MTRWMIVLGALNLAACSSDDGGKDTSDTAGTAGGDSCANSVVTTYPTAAAMLTSTLVR